MAQHGGDYSSSAKSAPAIDPDAAGQAAWLDPATPLPVLQGLLAAEPAVLRERCWPIWSTIRSSTGRSA